MARKQEPVIARERAPLWYKDAILYELHVRSYFDSNSDGIGDFRGLTEKLDYLRDLGVTALWVLPFYPSPLKDDGYDIADYYTINPIYGTLADFKTFLHEAHQRDLRVITELVINHTSDQHTWFQNSRRAKPGSAWRDFYVWSDTPEKYREARIIFRDFEPSNWTWDPVAKAYFWHRFYSHQPDLNYDNPQVHEEILRVLDFWLDLGVDGLRLDAIPYLYEREGTSCENLRETHDYLKTLRKHIDEKYGDRMLLAEANQWPEEAVTYFGQGQGDECHTAFHFPLMPRLFMAVRMEHRIPIIDILEQTPPIPETSQWALFLRNHDELTLEMVTDEERDYMYRVYAHDAKARINLGIRRRLAPLLGNDRKKIELLNLLLFSLPGTPVLYYGDEIAMGDNIFLGDRNGVRTPMQWSSDKNAGFSRASPQALFLPIVLDPEYHYESFNVEAHQGNPSSLLWWMKRLIALRKRHRAFGRGTIEFLQPENSKILAFVRRYEGEIILIVANLSRFPQPVELNLASFKATVPIELFGRTEFPTIGDAPYFLTLSPHAALWFALEPPRAEARIDSAASACAMLTVAESWDEIFTIPAKARLEACLPAYLRQRRWFGGKGRDIKLIHIRDAIPVRHDSTAAALVILAVEYVQGDPEEYLLPMAFAAGEEAERLKRDYAQFVVSPLQVEETNHRGILYDAVATDGLLQALFDAIVRRHTFKGIHGELRASTTSAFRQLCGDDSSPLQPVLARTEQSNTSVVFGAKLILKLYRRLESGTNPDLEVGRFLTSQGFAHMPPVAGALEYRRFTGEVLSFGILSAYLAEAQDAWIFTLEALGRYFERIRALPTESLDQASAALSLLEQAEGDISPEVPAVVGTYLESARLLGRRTAEMHLALASDAETREFAPEPFTPFYQRSLYQSMRNLVVQNFLLLRRSLGKLPALERAQAERLLSLETDILKRFRKVHEKPMSAMRIRCHGDFHLGQVLHTGKDFVITDFEGEPARPLGERRIKRSPLRDVGGMIRSFHYATYAAAEEQFERGNLSPDQLAAIEPWTRLWYRWVSAAFLRAYLPVVRPAELLPSSPADLDVLLTAHVLEKAIYEIGYELNNRPQWTKIPIQGILQLIEVAKP
ncbi:MAG: maltose alpha-D-glucosyltransferase, partial [Verrucomicrobiales bacterium]|nr:maltose alpha-D-glucosyltransferase [Verrucomicrobiales bacterium]